MSFYVLTQYKCRDCLVVSMSASHWVGCGFAPSLIIPKTIIRILLLGTKAFCWPRSLAVQPDCMELSMGTCTRSGINRIPMWSCMSIGKALSLIKVNQPNNYQCDGKHFTDEKIVSLF